jgi:ABC-2 type transport system permease protein
MTMLKGLSEEVTIYGLFKPGQEPSNIVEVLNRYKDASTKIKLQYLDIDKNPAFAKKYDTTGKGIMPSSLVVVAQKSGRSKVIPYADLYDVTYDQNTGEPRVQGVSIEQQVTGALMYLASGRATELYELTGHGEDSISALGVEDDVRKENYDLKTLNLLTSKDVPGDADLLLVSSPKADIQASEAQAIKAFLEKGGNAVFMLDIGNKANPNIEGVINLYGVRTVAGIVMEGSADKAVGGNPVLLLPDYADHPILKSIKDQKYPITMPVSQGLLPSPVSKGGLDVKPLLSTSKDSWIRMDLNDNSQTRIASDKTGPWVLAYAVEARKDDPAAKTTRLVLTGSSIFIDPRNPVMSPGNKEFFMNALGWAQNRNDTLSLRPKSLFKLPVSQNGLQAIVSIALIAIVVPFGILIAGLVIWLKRRHR